MIIRIFYYLIISVCFIFTPRLHFILINYTVVWFCIDAVPTLCHDLTDNKLTFKFKMSWHFLYTILACVARLGRYEPNNAIPGEANKSNHMAYCLQRKDPNEINWKYRKIHNIRLTKYKTEMFFISSCSCLCPVHWDQLLSQEWQAVLQLHLSDQQFDCLYRCALYERFEVRPKRLYLW